MFYDEWDDNASRVLFSYDDELQAICRNMKPLDLDEIVSLKKYYESESPEQLTKKLKSIKAFEVVEVPLVKSEKGYVPDFSSRMFVEDFPFGIAIIKYFAVITKTKTPTIDNILEFYQRISGIEYFDKNDMPGKDFNHSGIPANYGLISLDDIVSFYC